MIDRLRKRNIFIIIVEFLIILLIVFGITYALYVVGDRFDLNTVSLGIDEEVYGDTYLDSDDIKLEPINDEDRLNSSSSVLKVLFNVRGSADNIVNNIIYDISLNDLNIDCELISEYLKWELYKNGKVISSGNFSNSFDTIVDGRLVLTNLQEDLVDYGSEPDKYEFIMWLSDSCQEKDISMCNNSVDQSNLLNKTISGRIDVELYSGSKSELVRNPSTSIDYSSCVKNLDESGANRPVIESGMIPVYYESGNWLKADSNNSNIDYKWYDYGNKMWANILIVSDYSKYEDIELGSVINNDDILAIYVWIPRYKYQVFNIDSSNFSDSLEEINIIFESGKSNTGEITCYDDKCVGNNMEWLTHPAFTKDNIKGFWVAKYEVSGSYEKPKIVLSSDSLTGNDMTSFLDTSLKILNYADIDFNVDVISNLEWGSISYLAYSKYGYCNDGICNKNVDSSTDNIYGVFNMDSLNDEFVKYDINILGSDLEEINSSYKNLSFGYLCRGGMFLVSDNKSSCAFRNVLYK